jgi:hypothetical protein
VGGHLQCGDGKSPLAPRSSRVRSDPLFSGQTVRNDEFQIKSPSRNELAAIPDPSTSRLWRTNARNDFNHLRGLIRGTGNARYKKVELNNIQPSSYFREFLSYRKQEGNGTPGWIRTSGLLLRSLAVKPYIVDSWSRLGWFPSPVRVSPALIAQHNEQRLFVSGAFRSASHKAANPISFALLIVVTFLTIPPRMGSCHANSGGTVCSTTFS